MLLHIILLLIFILLVIKYNTIGMNEKFDIRYTDPIISELPVHHDKEVLPDGSVFLPSNITYHEATMKDCDDAECARIDNHRHKFFEFNDRINHSTHLDDSVDNINTTNKAQNYLLGTSIADIYDDLVNSREYKNQGNIRKMTQNMRI